MFGSAITSRRLEHPGQSPLEPDNIHNFSQLQEVAREGISKMNSGMALPDQPSARWMLSMDAVLEDKAPNCQSSRKTRGMPVKLRARGEQVSWAREALRAEIIKQTGQNLEGIPCHKLNGHTEPIQR